MAAKFKVGTPVVQVLPAPVRGVIDRFIFDESSGDIHYVVKDETGHESIFREENIKAE